MDDYQRNLLRKLSRRSTAVPLTELLKGFCSHEHILVRHRLKELETDGLIRIDNDGICLASMPESR